MIRFDINSRIGKLRYRASMDRQMNVFERWSFRKLKRYFKDLYRKIARQIREQAYLNVDRIIDMGSRDLFAIMMNMFHRTSVHYSEMFAEAINRTRGKALVDVFWEFYRNFAKMYVANRVIKINNTTKKGIIKIIETGLADQLTTIQISVEINKLSEINSLVRAKTIAATEIHTISNLTQDKMAKSESIIMEKEWLSAVDERVRPWHYTGGGMFSESGQTSIVRMGEFFYVGGEFLEYPGDPLGSGFNIANCRCFTAYYTTKSDIGMF